jgi:hypothetical protein
VAPGMSSGGALESGPSGIRLGGGVNPDQALLWNAGTMLTGDRKGTWSLSVTRNRRLTFSIDTAEQEICDLNLEDYH